MRIRNEKMAVKYRPTTDGPITAESVRTFADAFLSKQLKVSPQYLCILQSAHKKSWHM